VIRPRRPDHAADDRRRFDGRASLDPALARALHGQVADLRHRHGIADSRRARCVPPEEAVQVSLPL
jgi:hypothetical protein